MLFQDISSDLRRYRATGRDQGSTLAVVFLCQGFWASSGYRLGRRLQRIPAFGRAAAILIRKFHEVVAGICLPAEAEIGPGLYIGHFGPLVVHPRAKIGANCNLSQGVTIGAKQAGARQGTPVLGDRVYVGPNAVIVGAVRIGDDVAIGAGAIVLDDIPDRGVVAGNPARLLHRRGSFDLVSYDTMADDPDRRLSLAAASEESST